jgi:hypothetical protein
VYRDRLAVSATDTPTVVNGYLCGPPPPDSPNCLFAGVYVERGRHFSPTVGWLARTRFPVAGVRDPATLARTAGRSPRVDFVGCATLTLDPYKSPRRGSYAVDLPTADRRATPLTHRVPRGMTWPEQWTRAGEVLAAYRTAERVYASRLHVVLPCLAFGTPVLLARPRCWFGLTSAQGRFSLFDALGLPYGTLVEQDVGCRRDRFVRFLEASLGHSAGPFESVDPPLPLPPAGASTQEA